MLVVRGHGLIRACARAAGVAGTSAHGMGQDLLRRKPAKLVAVALANKLARIAWKLMVSAEVYSVKPLKPQPVATAGAK